MITLTTLKEIKEYLNNNDFGIDDDVIVKKFNSIDNIIQRVNSTDKQWVSCSTPHEVDSTVSAINDIMSPALANSTVKEAVEDTCAEFKSKGITNKPRIPFYVVALNKLF